MSIEKCMVKYGEYVESESSRLSESFSLHENEKSETLTTGNNVEINEVLELDPHVAPVSKPSQLIERLNAKRKLRHEDLINKLGEALNDLNIKIEEDVRISSEEVKAHINKDRRDLRELLSGLDTPESASYHDSVFLGIRERADSMKSNRLRMIKELHQGLNEMEDVRSVENNKIFRIVFGEMEKNSYINSFQLRDFAESEALKMNQLSLNNRRCYEDLKLKLVLGAEHMFKSFMDEVFCIKEKWIRNNMMESTDYLPEKIERKHFKIPDAEKRVELKGHELNLKPTPDGSFNISTWEEWLENVKDVTKVIGSYQNALDEMLKRVLESIGNDLSNENEADRKFLLSFRNIRFEERLIRPILFETSGGIDEGIINGLEERWQDALKSARDEIGNLICYLEGFFGLWTNHGERLSESKILVLKAVEKAEENDRSTLLDLEVNLNMNLDLLRQEYNKDKIESLYKVVTANLDSIKDKLEKGYGNKAKITEEYYKMVDLESDVLSSELKEFIFVKNLNGDRGGDSGSHENQIFLISEAEEDTGLKVAAETSRSIDNFSADIKSMRYRMLEVNNELEKLCDNARDRLCLRAEEWVNNRIRDMSRKYETQLEIHNKRYGRVRSQIYQVRIDEIRVHRRVFDEHISSVREYYKGLTLEIGVVQRKGKENIGKWMMKAVEIMEEAKKEDKPDIVRCIQAKMSKEKSDFIRELKTESDRIRGEIDLKMFYVQESNLKFMKSIKLFHENGNYDGEEAKIYANDLENIEKEIKAEAKALAKDINKKESEIVEKIADIFDEANRVLSQIYDEVKFNSDVNNLARGCEHELLQVCENLRSDFEILIEQNCFINHCCSDVENFTCEEQDAQWISLINSIRRNVCNLLYEMEPHVPEGASDEAEVNISPDSREEEMEPKAKGGFSPKDYTHELFESSLLNGSVSLFINIIRNKCWKYMGFIQRASFAFYKRTGSKALIRQDIIRGNNEDFVFWTLEEFRSFVLRCEQVWMEIISSFLPLLAKLDMLFEEYFERRAREFSEKAMAALDNYEQEFSKCFAEKARILSGELQSFDNRLMPLHGHPNNRQLFDALEDEVVRKTAQLELDWEIFIKENRAKLKTLYADTKHHPQWRALRSFYLKCQGVLFSNALKKDLLNYLMEVVEKGGFTKVKGKRPQETEGFDSYTSVESLRKDLRNIEEYLNVSKGALLREAKNFDDFLGCYIIKIENRRREVKEFVKSKSNFHKRLIFEWLNHWKANMGKIFELYTVKYGHSKDIFEGSFE